MSTIYEDVKADKKARDKARKYFNIIKKELKVLTTNPSYLSQIGKLYTSNFGVYKLGLVLWLNKILEDFVGIDFLFAIFPERRNIKGSIGTLTLVDGEHKCLYLFFINESEFQLKDKAFFKRIYLKFDAAEGTFIHEMIHYLDQKRLKRPQQVMDTIERLEDPTNYKDSPDPRMAYAKGYYNNPMEYNAYYQGMMNDVDGLLKKMTKELRKKLYPDFETFYHYFTSSPENMGFISSMTPDIQKRLRKRMYQYYTKNIQERATSSGNDDLFFLDGDESKDVTFEEEEPKNLEFLQEAVFINGHLIEKGTAFEIRL